MSEVFDQARTEALAASRSVAHPFLSAEELAGGPFEDEIEDEAEAEDESEDKPFSLPDHGSLAAKKDPPWLEHQKKK